MGDPFEAFLLVHGEAGVHFLVFPGGADPVVRRIVGGEPHEVLVRACHDVQVVHVVARSGNAGAVIAVGHKGNIAIVNLAAQVDADLTLGLVGDVFTICAVLDWKDVDT
jgi:hypothetical protein